MTRYLPILLGIVLIVGLTIPQIRITDRFTGTSFNTEERAELLSLVPKDFGDWHGEDKPVDPEVQKTAGAIGAVSRAYRNSRTGERVDLWLIVGHSRNVSFHTPNVCYPASGFEARGKDNSLYPLVMPGIPDTPMWTNTFFKEDVTGRDLIRVFWTWYNAESADNNGEIVWEAPANPRWRFGNSRALYKMYFTSEMRDPMETAEQSAALHFAKDFLPIVNKALAEVYHKLNANDSGGSAAEKPAAARTKTLSESSDATKTTPAAEERTDAAASKDQSPSTPAAESPKADQ